jgi:hypothetical protein
MTLEETLKSAGFNDTEIAAMDARVKTAFGSVAAEAEKIRTEGLSAREAAELEKRKMDEWFEKEVTPSINNAYSQVAQEKAQAAFYKTQAEAAKAQGFTPADAPGYVAPKPGERTPGAPVTPGTPTYMTADEGYRAITTTQNLVLEYQRLHPGKVMPDGIDTLAREAREQRQPIDVYAAKKYNFEGRKAEIAAATAKEHEDKIRADERALVEKKYAERMGSNPDLRAPQSSQFSTIRETPDGAKHPGSMNPRERHASTQKFLQARMSNSIQ